MKKSTLLKKTKDELANMLIALDDEHELLKNDYEEVCDRLSTKTEEDNEYIDSMLSVINKYQITIAITCSLLIASIVANVCIII